ncbi:MAG: DNA polymerase III subunit epsilon [Gammaproteobacteria bacterium]
MRQVVLDTETTGLEYEKGHRIIEIGCVELLNRRRTGNHFHRYINPQREIDPAAAEVHGITSDQLADKPVFDAVAESLLEFIDGAELIIHNADFDAGFLNHELHLMDQEQRIEDRCSVIDSLVLARELHPGQRNSLDALCRRYFIDNSSRDLHGALLDAQLLADVYLAMTGGQGELGLDRDSVQQYAETTGSRRVRREDLDLVVRQATAAELESHEQYLDLMDTACGEGALWRRLDA